jgi:hypothetical protein
MAKATRELVRGLSGCIVSDQIAVTGKPIGRMTHDPSTQPEDSGWTFFSNAESTAYLADHSNFSVWHLNDVANHDPAIVPLLCALPGARYERDRKSGGFVEAPDSKPDPRRSKLPRGITVVTGDHAMAPAWLLRLPVPYRRRIEDGSVVLWRHGVTVWTHTVDDAPRTRANRVAELRKAISPKATELRITDDGRVVRIAYRLTEEASDGRQPALYGFVVADTGYIRLGIYFDRETDAPEAYAILESCTRRS